VRTDVLRLRGRGVVDVAADVEVEVAESANSAMRNS
jgi:hypothetical protein